MSSFKIPFSQSHSFVFPLFLSNLFRIILAIINISLYSYSVNNKGDYVMFSLCLTKETIRDKVQYDQVPFAKKRQCIYHFVVSSYSVLYVIHRL